MKCYSNTLIAKLHFNIYLIVVKCRRTFCLHAYFFGVSRFHKCFSISPFFFTLLGVSSKFFLPIQKIPLLRRLQSNSRSLTRLVYKDITLKCVFRILMTTRRIGICGATGFLQESKEGTTK